MIKQTKWFERTFDFNFPVGLFPCILERIRETPERVEAMIRTFPPSFLTRRVDDGWSIQEHIGHLYDLDELHDGRIDDYLQGLKVLRTADLQNKKTFTANHNSNSIENVISLFRQARQNFVSRLEQIDETQAVLSAEHPRLKRPMRLVDMMYFVAEHDDHHLALATAICRRLGK